MNKIIYLNEGDPVPFQHLPLYEPISEIEVNGKRYMVIKKTKKSPLMKRIVNFFKALMLITLSIGTVLGFKSFRAKFIRSEKTLIEMRILRRSPEISRKTSPLQNPTKIDKGPISTTAKILAAGDFKHKSFATSDSVNGFKICEAQGSEEFRKQARLLTLNDPGALDPKNLKRERNINKINYLALKLKRLGHAFSLEKNVSSNGKKFGFEGFSEDFTIPELSSSLISAETHLKGDGKFRFAGEHLNRAFSNEWCPDAEIIEALKTIHNPDSDEIVSLVGGYQWHSIFIAFFKGHLIYLNKGNFSNGGINIYKLPNPKRVTRDLLLRLIKRQDISRADFSTNYSEGKLVSKLMLNKIASFKLKSQKVGNCTYCNTRGGARILMAIHSILKEGQKELTADIWTKAFDKTRDNYKRFVQYDRDIVLDDFVEDLNNGENDFDFFKAKEICQLLLKRNTAGYQQKHIDALELEVSKDLQTILTDL